MLQFIVLVGMITNERFVGVVPRMVKSYNEGGGVSDIANQASLTPSNTPEIPSPNNKTPHHCGTQKPSRSGNHQK